MKSLGDKIGVAVGLILSILLVVPMIDLLMGGCFYEQGCGKFETFWLIGALLASCIGGFFAGWFVMRLFRLIDERHD